VNLLEFDETNFVFELGKREKRLLLEVLKLYPLIPSTYHKPSKSLDETEVAATQKLLQEALAERKQESKKQLQSMLNEVSRFKETKSGYRFILSPQQADWLLEVINDIRVGSWILLGQPDEKQGTTFDLTETNARYLWAMEVCGYFQFALLKAFELRSSG